MNIRSVLFKPSIFRQWLCDVQVLERLWQGYTLCNLFGNHSLETHSSPCFIKGSLEYSGPSRKFFNARGSESIIERFQNQLQYDCKRSINHRVAKWSTNYRYSSELECVNKDQKQEVAVFSNLLAVLWFFFLNGWKTGISSYCRKQCYWRTDSTNQGRPSFIWGWRERFPQTQTMWEEFIKKGSRRFREKKKKLKRSPSIWKVHQNSMQEK